MSLKVGFELVELEHREVIEVFEARYQEMLHNYLYAECALDRAGINRVMPLLAETFANGYKGFIARFALEAKGSDDVERVAREVEEGLDGMNADIVRHTCDQAINLLTDAHKCMLLSMAGTLASHDEEIHPRPRH